MADENSENSARAASENSEQAARESDVIDFNDEAVRLGDHIVRGTAADGQVRAFAVTARASVRRTSGRPARAASSTSTPRRFVSATILFAERRPTARCALLR